MKTLTLILIFIVGCTDNRNDLMTKLINQRKQMTDFLTAYKAINQHLNDEAEYVDSKGKDSAWFRRMLDTARMANDGISKADSIIPALTFSIDSLSKMK